MHRLTYIPADLRDVQIREHLRKIELLEEGCQDLESTIGQFRELVLQLQMCVIFYIKCSLRWLISRVPQRTRHPPSTDTDSSKRICHCCVSDRRHDVLEPQITVLRIQESSQEH
jgi:hypothetical protein